MRASSFFKPRKSASSTSIFAAVILAVMLVAYAQDAVASAPEWLRAAAQASLPKYAEETNAVVLLDEQITTVTDAGEIKTLYRRAYKILRPEGRGLAVVPVHFDAETRLTRLK